MNILIIGTNEQKKYHEYFNPFQCKCDKALPPMYNGGWNDYHFTESVNFTFKDMPLIERKDRNQTKNYFYYECQIQVTDPTGRVISGNYYITYDKNEQKFISENVDFS